MRGNLTPRGERWIWIGSCALVAAIILGLAVTQEGPERALLYLPLVALSLGAALLLRRWLSPGSEDPITATKQSPPPIPEATAAPLEATHPCEAQTRRGRRLRIALAAYVGVALVQTPILWLGDGSQVALLVGSLELIAVVAALAAWWAVAVLGRR
jgi:hypothetical protein